jgi:hypothetical protein
VDNELVRLFEPSLDGHPTDRESVRAVMAELATGKDIVGFECREVCADIDSAPGGGTSLVVTLPLDAEPVQG